MLLYTAVKYLVKAIGAIYFQKINVIGLENIPEVYTLLYNPFYNVGWSFDNLW